MRGREGKDFLEHSIIFPRMPNHLDFLGVSDSLDESSSLLGSFINLPLR